MSQCTSLPYQSYGQYWLDEEGCECGPFVIEPVSSDDSNKDVTVRELKLSYEPQVRPNSQHLSHLQYLNSIPLFMAATSQGTYSF